MELQGKVLDYKPWKPVGPELFANSDLSGKEKFSDPKLNDPRYPGWILSCLSAREHQLTEEERKLELDHEVYKTGNTSQKVIFPTVAASWSLKRKIKLTPGRHYRAAAVVKGEEPRNLRLQVTPAGRQAVIARAAENNSWQTLTADFFMPEGVSDAEISVWGGKTTAGKAAWIDSVSVRELTREGMAPEPVIPKVKLTGENRITAKSVWRTNPASAKVKRLPDGAMEITVQENKALMATCAIKLKPGTAWRFRAESTPQMQCSVMLADGRKLSANKYSSGIVDFTSAEKEGSTQLRLWIGAQKPDTVIKIKPPALFQIEK